MFTFSLPDNFVASTTQYAFSIISNPQIAGLVSAIIGIGLGLLVLEVLIGIFRKH